ncbi:hypothetical protein QPX96_01715 [Limosilactobacillus fermentum]|nr:hypothetical protein [Limosilactobacillus fermentum]
MNQLVNSPKPIAPLIGTTNYNGGFSMARETARRTYYLQLDKVIDDQQKSEATKYIYNVRKILNNTLFKDFVVRMANLLEDDQTPWRTYNKETGLLDFLAMPRRIFKGTTKWSTNRCRTTSTTGFSMTSARAHEIVGLSCT